MGEIVIIFEVVMTSSVYIDHKKKDTLIPGIGSIHGLDATALTEAQYSINFSRSSRKFCLSLHFNGSKVSYFLTLQKYVNSKQKILKLKSIGNILGDFSANNVIVDYKAFDISEITNIHKYLIKKHVIK